MRISSYFRQIEQTIEDCPAIITKEVSCDQRTSYLGFIKGSLTFADSSCLYFKEFIDTEKTFIKFKYGYHYQKHNKLIFRYDNRIHSVKFRTFPHHKHLSPSKIIAVTAVPTLTSVLKEIISLVP